MSDCCTPKGYQLIFSERSARAEARRYRCKGLDPTSRRIVELLKEQGVEGRTLLEVGGGIGAIQIELLKAGATRAVNVELMPTYEEAAGALLREARFEDRVERRVMDFAEAGGEAEAADVVVMNRVICCYPDMPRLAGAATDHARGVLVMSFPKERWWTRLGLALANFGLRVTRRQFRIFLHPPDRPRPSSTGFGRRSTGLALLAGCRAGEGWPRRAATHAGATHRLARPARLAPACSDGGRRPRPARQARTGLAGTTAASPDMY